MPRYVKTPVATGTTDGVVVPAGTSGQRPPSPGIGTLRFNVDNQVLEVFNGVEFKSVTAQGKTTITKDTFTGDGSTTDYTLSLEPLASQNIIVFVGNVFQIADTNYTISGTTITFTSAPPDTHTIVVLHGFDSTEVS
jgi:hypothetical protein